MKTLRTILAVLLCLGATAARAQFVTANIIITNTGGTTNGQTITVNGDQRTWTNAVFLSTQILTNNTIGGAATNMFAEFSSQPFVPVLYLSWSGTNGVNLQTAAGVSNMTVTLSPGWGTVTFTTNTTTPAVAVRIPTTVEAAGQQTNIDSGLVAALNNSANTNSLDPTATVTANLVTLTNVQTVSGNKAFTGTSNYVAGMYASGPKMTNGINYGFAFSSPGTGLSSEQFGHGAGASKPEALAVGLFSIASGTNSTSVGNASNATGDNSTSLGYQASAGSTNAVALGANASAALADTVSIGSGASTAGFSNAVAIGRSATATGINQIMMGTSSHTVVIPGTLQALGNTTLSASAGGNNFSAGSDIAFGRFSLSTLANGNNAAVPVGTNVFVDISGPTGAFTINGIAGGRDGKLLILQNLTGQNMTLANQSGTDPTPANRIICLTGADKTVTGNSAAILIYNANSSRWIVLSFTQ